MKELAIEYVSKLQNEPIFKELLALKNTIDEKYKKEIIRFKLSEAQYSEARKYESYRDDLIKIKDKFIQAKTELYSRPEVKRYFELERDLQNILTSDFNEIKNYISNKFTMNKTISIK